MTVDCDRERVTDRANALVAQAAESVEEYTDRQTLDRVEVDDTAAWNRIDARLEDDLTGSPLIVVARGNQGAAQLGNGSISPQHDDRTAADVGQLAPPELAAPGPVGHEAPAARTERRKVAPLVGSIARLLVVRGVRRVDLRSPVVVQQRRV